MPTSEPPVNGTKKRGAPKLDPELKRSEKVIVALRPGEHERLLREAESRGMSPSVWVRMHLLDILAKLPEPEPVFLGPTPNDKDPLAGADWEPGLCERCDSGSEPWQKNGVWLHEGGVACGRYVHYLNHLKKEVPG